MNTQHSDPYSLSALNRDYGPDGRPLAPVDARLNALECALLLFLGMIGLGVLTVVVSGIVGVVRGLVRWAL